ncbi:thioredoxin-like 4, chloroplastic [Humulus lupulus]|uniref:thioredoxin-like 4, chloroplastic n=1 Tax=Humulus lupulus TaxID=3486 RepID=UPI002B408ADC|nr:thioredoxin-like 4, chloroplastic [Humulus lupulus]XP_062098043.1 thioredoxin-like 4, chloroplastic [Humulus lupulus]XP_062098044.1 thioredoxin-like 4, chloroplastic [Humulus lupulus]
MFVAMQGQNAVHYKELFSFRTSAIKRQFKISAPSILSSSNPVRTHVTFSLVREKISLTPCCTIRPTKIKAADGNQGELPDEDDDLCPVDCVREFKTDDEFLKILDKAKEHGSLVVVDFYRTSCGSCKYIEQGFAKLCRGAGDEEASVIFLKHNVIDEYDEQSEVAERLRIKTVPLFYFYKNGVLLEAFPTRDKERIIAAIRKYTSPASPAT